MILLLAEHEFTHVVLGFGLVLFGLVFAVVVIWLLVLFCFGVECQGPIDRSKKNLAYSTVEVL